MFEGVNGLGCAFLEDLEVLFLQVGQRHAVLGRVDVDADVVRFGPKRRLNRVLRVQTVEADRGEDYPQTAASTHQPL